MSSTMASVSRNSRRSSGIDGATRARTPSAKAMSVAIGMPQPPGSGPDGLSARKSSGGYDHAAHGCDDRQRRLTAILQLAEQQLALDLEADDEEEDRHQPVVHPVPKVELERRSGRRARRASVCQSVS